MRLLHLIMFTEFFLELITAVKNLNRACFCPRSSRNGSAVAKPRGTAAQRRLKAPPATELPPWEACSRLPVPASASSHLSSLFQNFSPSRKSHISHCVLPSRPSGPNARGRHDRAAPAPASRQAEAHRPRGAPAGRRAGSLPREKLHPEAAGRAAEVKSTTAAAAAAGPVCGVRGRSPPRAPARGR